MLITDINSTEYAPFQWCTEASDLGMTPGRIPRVLATTMGNSQPFILQEVTPEAFFYKQAFGALQLKVFND